MKKLFFLFGFSLIGVIAPVFAELPTKVRDNLSDIIKDYCHSRVEYSIDDFMGTWDVQVSAWSEKEVEKAHEFHKTINCIFDGALNALTEGEKSKVKEAFISGAPLQIETFSLKTDCDEIQIIQGIQSDNGFESKCDGSEVEEIKKAYSMCKVAETVLQEWCGYDLFLYAKMQDEESFYKSQPSEGGHNELSSRFRMEKKKMAEERERVERAIFSSLEWYEQTVSAATQDAWLVAIQTQLQKINEQWTLMRSALGTFVDKFLNASIPPTS